jgi:hypothetical protein
MAGIKIVDLPEGSLPYTGNEKIPITQSGQTRNGTLNSLSQAFWETLRPNVLELDYIELADQSGFTIPENSLGRKGNVPYFGELPITPNKEYFFAGSLQANGTEQRVVIARIPVNEVFMQPNTQIRFGFDLQMHRSETAAEYVLLFSWENAAISEGDFIYIGKSEVENVIYDGSVVMTPNNNQLQFQLDLFNKGPILFGNLPDSARDGNLKGKILLNGTDMGVSNPSLAAVGQSNFINISISDYTGHPVGNNIVVKGHARVGGVINYIQLT